MTDALHEGLEAYDRRAWEDAYARLSSAGREAPLGPDALERLATAAHLTAREEESADAWARAHHERLRAGDLEGAVRCASRLVVGLLHRGEVARGNGWVARAARLVEEHSLDCADCGYLCVAAALRAIGQGDFEAAHVQFRRAEEIGRRFGEADLTALAGQGRGRVLIRLGDVQAGVALLDEAMAAVEAGAVSPSIAGVVYCSVIDACHETFDLRRAQEWTAALSHWCDAQPQLVPYRGVCRVRRAEILRLHGEWTDAMAEARRACEARVEPPRAAMGAALYQQAELHRLGGALDAAEAAYRRVAELGRSPHPGLALLRLAQGQVDAAEAAIRRERAESREPRSRAPILSAAVEILLAAGDVAGARAAADELGGLAAELDAPLLHASADHARGQVLLAGGEPAAALEALRRALASWEELRLPYEAARARVLAGLACRGLGDEDMAGLELGAARAAFDRLGAAPDAARAARLARPPSPHPPSPLTDRELQVLRRVAAGDTNRGVAEALFISERTVERHVSNIFVKLGVSSRAAATAYAYEHDLV